MKSSFVYFIQAGAGGPIKIGKADDVQQRLGALQIGCPSVLTLLAAAPGDERTERSIHQRLAAHRMRAEWFHPTPEVLSAVREAIEGRLDQVLEPDQVRTIDPYVALMREALWYIAWPQGPNERVRDTMARAASIAGIPLVRAMGLHHHKIEAAYVGEAIALFSAAIAHRPNLERLQGLPGHENPPKYRVEWECFRPRPAPKFDISHMGHVEAIDLLTRCKRALEAGTMDPWEQEAVAERSRHIGYRDLLAEFPVLARLVPAPPGYQEGGAQEVAVSAGPIGGRS